MTDEIRELLGRLRKRVENVKLSYTPQLLSHEAGDTLELSVKGVWPETEVKLKAKLELSAGGGFAGQVYRCRVEDIDESQGRIEGLEKGKKYRIKILIPPSRGRLWFRNLVYWLAFQGPFSAQINGDSARAGAIWQKIIQRAARCEFGRDNAIPDIYGTFYDEKLSAYGQISEWVLGRTWRLEPDLHPELRKDWYNAVPEETGSPEYIAKRQFMARLVKMLHSMGGHEFARQYEWWTMKSQPNVLKRDGAGDGPADGLCAIDFRAGLALLPYLPMSVGDFKLIIDGLMRGSLTQFDRCVHSDLDRYVDDHKEAFADMADAVSAFKKHDAAYRRSLPDVPHHGWMLMLDPELRADVRRGLIEGYRSARLVDDKFAGRIEDSGWAFARFYMLGSVPLLGRFARRMWGNEDYREHVLFAVSDPDYFTKAEKTAVAMKLTQWLKKGRIGDKRARLLMSHPALFWVERYTVGIIFNIIPRLHRPLMEPFYMFKRIGDGWRFMRAFFKDESVREKWLTDQIEEGYEDGMLDDEEKTRIMERVKDPFIVKYLKSVAVHFCTLPVTQIVSVATAWIVGRWMIFNGYSGTEVSAAVVGILVGFQLTPISPGSLCRGGYVVYLMIKDRDAKDYLIACPMAFLKYVGYLSFPMQMVAAYPALSRYMASRWATSAVKGIPVFGEKGALLEHMVFNQCFNRTMIFFKWSSVRIKLLLNIWMVFGLGLALLAIQGCNLSFEFSKDNDTFAKAVNVVLAFIVLFVLPRVLFYPVMSRNGSRQEKL